MGSGFYDLEIYMILKHHRNIVIGLASYIIFSSYIEVIVEIQQISP